jgi:diguanylate cyclase (GGDEF)-like protein
LVQSSFSRDADSEASLDEREAYVTHTPLPPPTGLGATILKIALVILAGEILIMLGFDLFGIELSRWNLALVDAALLTLVVAPIAYFAFLRPKDRQIRRVIMALEEAKLEAEEDARFDELTDALTRRALIEVFDIEVARAKRYGSTLSCLMLDLDHFKKFNDTYGHQFGDRVLYLVARVISGHCRTHDYLGRYGGEEFLIVLPETRIDGATVFAERVRAAVAETPLGQDEERITVSIGVAQWHDGDDSVRNLVSRADQALLQAKAAGRNRIIASESG